MWLKSEKNIRLPDDRVARSTFATALRYAGYRFTSTAPGFVAAGNPWASGASASAFLGSTFAVSGFESSAWARWGEKRIATTGKVRASRRMMVFLAIGEIGPIPI